MRQLSVFLSLAFLLLGSGCVSHWTKATAFAERQQWSRAEFHYRRALDAKDYGTDTREQVEAKRANAKSKVQELLRRERAYRRIKAEQVRLARAATEPGYFDKPGQLTQASVPSVYDVSSFAFFATSGTFRVYKLGKVIEEGPTTDFGDGSIRFFVLGPRTAMMLGNQGTAEVQVFRPGSGLSFVEVTPLGNKHIFTVSDEWLPEKQGFRATYNRTVEFMGETLRSTYSGYAREVR